MTEPADSPTPTGVLIVDQSAETREVLRTVLERRGVDIWEAQAAADGLEILRERHPAVVVLDLEVEPAATTMQEAFESESQRGQASLVLLGRTQVPVTCASSRTIDKPYHYGPLIRTIEQLLEQH